MYYCSSGDYMRKVMGLSAISPQYQTTIPKKIRDYLKLENTLIWILDDGRIYVEKAS